MLLTLMKKTVIPLLTLFLCSNSLAQEGSWQSVPNDEEPEVTTYYWDVPTTNKDNSNLKITRILAHGSDYGASLVFEVTFDCASTERLTQLNRMEVFSEEFAKGDSKADEFDSKQRWESSNSPDMTLFRNVYNQICK